MRFSNVSQSTEFIGMNVEMPFLRETMLAGEDWREYKANFSFCQARLAISLGLEPE